MAAKGNRTAGFLQRNLRDCTAKVRFATYITMVCPTLEYASTVLDPYKQTDALLLKRYTVEQQGTPATTSETSHLVPYIRCSTV